MTSTAIASAAGAVVQLVGGIVLAPLLPGLIQYWKARLQGRPGPSPLQPYRELRRLWRKSTVDVAGATAVYRLAPSLAAASLLGAIGLVPVVADSPDLGVGHDVIALIGLLAIARFALAAAAWDTGSGFSLMGASRDLTISVFNEVALLLAVTVAAIVTRTTSLTGMISGTAGGHVWSSPALPLGTAAFALVVIAETGRQPFDNPDTHLELTMIHEGPLLEYAGRDLAYLHWVSAARHWLLLVLAAVLFLPHPHGTWAQLALLPAELVAMCAALAVAETLMVKMRLLLAPRLLGIAAVVALLGIVARQAGIS
jgi:formate hydrogenlyase subunit 4